MQSPDPSIVDVAVGVVSLADGRVLLGQRPEGKPYAGWWEFPGGKIEAGESVHEALARELFEELGLQIRSSAPWLIREHRYEHAHVRLHFCRVWDFDGEPESRESQAFAWVDPADNQFEPLLPATVPLIRLLTLPPLYAISCATDIGVPAFIARLREVLAAQRCVVQLREPGMDDAQFAGLFDAALAVCREHHAPLLVNSYHPDVFWQRADGVHVRQRDIASLHYQRDRLNDCHWIAVSCHDAQELQQAADIGAHFATLSPVCPTRTHPDAPAMGWSEFQRYVCSSLLPVYALGGLQLTMADTAQAHGAHGMAMIRGVFSPR